VIANNSADKLISLHVLSLHWLRLWVDGCSMLKEITNTASIHKSFARNWHRLPHGPGNGSFVTAVPVSERTRKAGTWTVYKGGQSAKRCHMQQLGPGRLHRSSVSSQTHSQWTLWGLWLGHRCCGHGRSKPDRHGEGLPRLGRFSARWCIPTACKMVDNL